MTEKEALEALLHLIWGLAQSGTSGCLQNFLLSERKKKIFTTEFYLEAIFLVVFKDMMMVCIDKSISGE